MTDVLVDSNVLLDVATRDRLRVGTVTTDARVGVDVAHELAESQRRVK